MSKQPIIKVENIGKQYRLGAVGTGTLSHDINRWWHTVRGKEDPYLKIGDANDRTQTGGSDYVWALQDINFEVQPGEILGIIGKNGAGKSSLLKLLSRVTAPTTGKITCHGRIASLLEVGTGFHPELTGRENIYLNGAILGMTKKEIAAKFDEIVDFAGCAKYIETPVKRYSSGMYVRLAFAVAAHLEPDILVVDEVLAVGDAEFQKKAIGKMQEVSQGQGRTVLFVSHNMASVKSLCTKGLVLENGSSVFEGTADESVDYYLFKNNFDKKLKFKPSNSFFINQVKVEDVKGKDFFVLGDKVIFSLELKVEKSFFNKTNKIVIAIYNDRETKICKLSTEYSDVDFYNKNDNNLKCILDKIPIVAGNYFVNIAIYIDDKIKERYVECLKFTILDGDYYEVSKLIGKSSFNFVIDQKWE